MSRSGKILVILGAVALAALAGWLKRDWVIAQVYLAILESDERVRNLQVERIVSELELKPGDLVADVGAGTGLLSRPFARAVAPTGTVYAVDVNRELLEHIRATAVREGLDNLVTVEGDPDDPRLPEPVDVIVICDTLHHIESPDRYLARLPRYLKPGGRLAVIDFYRDQSPHWSSSLRIGAADVQRWAQAAGLRKSAEHDFIESNFFLIFSR